VLKLKKNNSGAKSLMEQPINRKHLKINKKLHRIYGLKIMVLAFLGALHGVIHHETKTFKVTSLGA
jgi:hypothetical protein